jgi:uncharacterized membrane protein YtjA (UPF0391 family)
MHAGYAVGAKRSVRHPTVTPGKFRYVSLRTEAYRPRAAREQPSVVTVGERHAGVHRRIPTREVVMLYYAAVFFIIALIAGVLGFGGMAAGAAGIAKILFIVFLIGAIITFFLGRRPT